MFISQNAKNSTIFFMSGLTAKDEAQNTTPAQMKMFLTRIDFRQLTSKDVVRHPLVQQIVQAYDNYEKHQKPERPERPNRRRNGGDYR